MVRTDVSHFNLFNKQIDGLSKKSITFFPFLSGWLVLFFSGKWLGVAFINGPGCEFTALVLPVHLN